MTIYLSEMYGLREHYSLDELEAHYRRWAGACAGILEHYWPKEKPDVVLDVGCGPYPSYMLEQRSRMMVGVDIDADALRRIVWKISTVNGTCLALPFKSGIFDVVLCHNLLLWVPVQETLKEMWRVTALGGRLICAGEPDYTKRIEIPVCLKEHVVSTMKDIGANPDIGGELGNFLSKLTDRYEVGEIRPNPEMEFQMKSVMYDVEFLSRVHEKDMYQKAKPIINALQAGKVSVHTPIYYGCAFK
jgi:SAM-dependent methyltransferase